jgi:hypothetical protein
MKAICTRAAVTVGAIGVALSLWGCGASPDASDGTGSAEQAVTSSTVTIQAKAFGNWSSTGVRTSGSSLTGDVGGVDHAGYYVFDITPIAGKTVTAISITVGNRNGSENLGGAKPGLRTTIRPFGNTPVATLTGGSNDKNVFAQIAGVSNSQDYTYAYIKASATTFTFGLLGYETTRIPDLVKAAKAGTELVLASYATNENGGGANEFMLNDTVTPTLKVTFQ